MGTVRDGSRRTEDLPQLLRMFTPGLNERDAPISKANDQIDRVMAGFAIDSQVPMETQPSIAHLDGCKERWVLPSSWLVAVLVFEKCAVDIDRKSASIANQPCLILDARDLMPSRQFRM